MNHRGRDTRRPVLGIEHGQAPAGGKPKASIAASGSTAAGGIPGRTLRAAQPIRHAVVHGPDLSDFAAEKIPNLLFVDAADPARRAEPQPPLAVILNVRNVIAQQAVANRDVEELAVPQRIQPAAERANP